VGEPESVTDFVHAHQEVAGDVFVFRDAIAEEDDDANDVVSTIKYLLYCYIIIYECLILRMNELHILRDIDKKNMKR
jgi:hypothetical protein